MPKRVKDTKNANLYMSDQPVKSNEMATGPYPSHEIADVVPLMEAEDLEKLADDIKQRGLREPILLLDGKVLDGRNRQAACLKAGVRPEYRPYHFATDGDSPAAFVVSKNLNRRHLTPMQRAALALELSPFFEREALRRMQAGQFGSGLRVASSEATPAEQQRSAAGPAEDGSNFRHSGELQPTSPGPNNGNQGKSAAFLGRVVGVSTSSVERAKRLKNQDPARFEQIKAGNANLARTVRSEQFDEAVKRIEEVCGKTQAKGIREGAILRNRKDVVAYAALPRDKMLAIRSLIDQGWSVKKAVHYKAEELMPTHNLRAAMERAVAEDGFYTQEVHDENMGLVVLFEMTVLSGEGVKAHLEKRKARAQKRAERL